MRPCATANAFSGALLLLVSFAGCSGGTSGGDPATSPEPPAPAAPDEPADPADSASADDPADEGGNEGAGDEDTGAEGDDEEGDDEEGAGEGSAPAAGGSSRDPKKIQEVIVANRKPVRDCYEKALEKIPGLKGTMTITLVIRPNGTVKSAALNRDRSDIYSPAVVDCAVAHLSKLDFGKHEKGMESTINYPFDFKP